MRIIRFVCSLVLVCVTPTWNSVAAQRSDTIVKIAGAPRYAGISKLVEELSIGVVNGPPEYMFAAFLNEVLPARDGTVWIADDQSLPGSSKLRQYDSSGKFLRSIGRAGQGPGEFLELYFVEQLPDGRVLLVDRRGGAVVLHVYSENGAPLAQHDLTTLRGQSLTPRYTMRMDPRGRLVYIPITTHQMSRAGELLTEHPVVRMSTDGIILDTIADPGIAAPPAQTVSTSSGVSRLTIGSPFAPHVESVWSPLGYWITGISSRYALDLRQPMTASAGQTTRPVKWQIRDPVVSIRRAAPPVAVSNEERQDRSRYMEETLAFQRGTLSGPIPGVAAVKPAFRSFFVADEGRIWVQVSVASERYEPAPRKSRDGRTIPALRWREPLRYDVFEPDGAYIGQVSVPYDTRLLTVRGDVVWAVTVDADEVKSVKRFRVAWGQR